MKKEGGKLKSTFQDRIASTKQNERDGSVTKMGPTDRAGYKPEMSKKARKM